MHPLAREDEFTLSHGGSTVRLRASLRAAMRLERLHDGFGPLLIRLAEGDTATIKTVIRTAAIDWKDAEAFLSAAMNKPLQGFLEAVSAPLLALCAAFFAPVSDRPAKPAQKPRPWSDAFADLYQIGTGWLGWTPAQTWAATPAEIAHAFDGHVAKLKAIHGTAEDRPDPAPISDENLAAIIAAGADPAFDCDGLAALKAKMTP